MSVPKRIGVLVPSTNQVVEPDFYSVLSKEITVHAEKGYPLSSSAVNM